MFPISADDLKAMIPNASEENLAKYLPALNDVLPQFSIDTPLRVAHFIAQVAHESGALRHSVENLNYSAAALRSVFGKYFTTDEMAQEYHRQPERIANVVYANRMGNGDSESGEGWKYRGRGLIQLTGKDNYHSCSQKIGLDLIANPDLVSDDPKVSVSVACWYWNSRNLNEVADNDDVLTVTKKINGGTHGLDDRKDYLDRCKHVLNIA
ncbi:glycoside hydrolase family 19 protein [Paraneptunicella aestuarii]|uniref:glycoside hydrolase family 19 protein n=1 Tax=Paraneptunicella aestuarii TaxID=2831148 RepID=UPI001E52F2DE|nr:glycoside hydrolase family 19 protein [Paraneptunicella aestuarii]UAA37909.1 glycoside hydrolase family 19 protein [Paraneptunicella aestuarii]